MALQVIMITEAYEFLLANVAERNCQVIIMCAGIHNDL